MRTSNHFMNDKIQQRLYEVFINSIKSTRSNDEVIDFLNDLLSSSERAMLAKRVSIAFMLMENKYSYEDIIRTLKVSDGTIAKVHSVLALQGKGYRKTIGNILLRKAVRNSLSEFLDLLTPLPTKGTSPTTHTLAKIKSKKERESPL